MTSYMSLGFGKYHGIFPDKLLVGLVIPAMLKSQLAIARQLFTQLHLNQSENVGELRHTLIALFYIRC